MGTQRKDILLTRSGFGGGWVQGLTPQGQHELEAFFGEPAYPLAPLGYEAGWIVEPHEVEGLHEAVTEAELGWELS